MSIYLEPSEYEDFGLPDTVTPAMVQAASALIDSHIGKPEGLIWSPDSGGAPAYMEGLTTTLSLAIGSGGMAPGQNVTVPYSGAALDNNSVGEAVVIDRTVSGHTETCVISAVSQQPPNTITFQNVQFNHNAGAVIEFGLTICEQKEMPKNRSTVVLAECPVMNVLSGVGRYGYGRRDQQITGNFQEFNLLAVVSNFGGPPLWIPWQVSDASVNRQTGELWVPAGILLAYYTEVKVWYVAGYQRSALPTPVKQACANITQMLKETGLGANVRRRDQRDGVSSSKFENNLIDNNTRIMLRPFQARRYG